MRAREPAPQSVLLRARKLWGKTAGARSDRCYLYSNGHMSCEGAHQQPCAGGVNLCVVGKVVMGAFFEVRGEGATWEAAFAAAEKNYPMEVR